jgi:uncharacterized protein involved in exopolysaccharide biosynthesis
VKIYQEEEKMEENEVDLRDYLRVIAKRRWIIIWVFLAAVIASGVVSFSLSPVYEAESMIKIGKIRDKRLEEASSVIEIFKGKPMLMEISERLDLPLGEEDLEKLAKRIEIREKASLLEVKGEGNTPGETVELVNCISGLILERHQGFFAEGKEILKEYIADTQEQIERIREDIKELQRRISQFETTDSEAEAMVAQGYMESLQRSLDRYNEFQTKVREKRMEEAYFTEPSIVEVPALMPEEPAKPRKKLNIAIAAVIGLMGGLFMAFIVEYFEKGKLHEGGKNP